MKAFQHVLQHQKLRLLKTHNILRLACWCGHGNALCSSLAQIVTPLVTNNNFAKSNMLHLLEYLTILVTLTKSLWLETFSVEEKLLKLFLCVLFRAFSVIIAIMSQPEDAHRATRTIRNRAKYAI
jgi:hypothetical protein